MFRKIIIVLTKPICAHPASCTHLSWTPYFSHEANAYGLRIICDTCQTTVEVPPPQFVARFALEPAKPKTDEAQPAKPVTTEQHEEAFVHERQFTPYDREWVKKWGKKYGLGMIKLDEEPKE